MLPTQAPVLATPAHRHAPSTARNTRSCRTVGGCAPLRRTKRIVMMVLHRSFDRVVPVRADAVVVATPGKATTPTAPPEPPDCTTWPAACPDLACWRERRIYERSDCRWR